MSQNLNRTEDDVWAAAINLACNICEQESTNCHKKGDEAGASLAKHCVERIKVWHGSNVENTWPILPSLGVATKSSNETSNS